MQTFKEGVARTWNKELSFEESLTNAALGLVCEAGEVGDEIKKYIFHGKNLAIDKVLVEIGDVLYYMQALLTALPGEHTIQECQELVIEKLKARHPEGFSNAYHKEIKQCQQV